MGTDCNLLYGVCVYSFLHKRLCFKLTREVMVKVINHPKLGIMLLADISYK